MRVFFWSFVFESLERLSRSSNEPNRFDRASLSAPVLQPRPNNGCRRDLDPAALFDLYEACKEFTRRCESGEVRSVRSYALMKAAVEKAEVKRPV